MTKIYALGRQSLSMLALLASSFALPVTAQEAPQPDSGQPAAPATPGEGGPAAEDELALDQSQIADKYARLEQLMLKMAEIEGLSNPKRAALLTRAVGQSKDRLTKSQLESLVKLLNQKQLKRAVDGQTTVQTDLKALLELLMSEDRSDRLKSEQQRIKEYIKEVERLIRLEKSVQGQTEGGADEKRMAQEQGRIAGQTGDLARKIRENEEGEPQNSSDKPPSEGDQQPGEEKPGEEKPGEQKPGEGDMPPGEQNPGEQKPSEGKPGEGKPSEAKPGEAKPGEQKPGEAKPGKQKKPGEEQPGEKKPSEEKPGDQKPGDGKPGEQKPSEGDMPPGEQKPGEQKPGEQKPGQQGQPGQSGEQGQQQDQQQQDQQENPARKRLEQAQQKMQDAQKKLEDAKRKESLEDQRAAREELEKAKAELEEILRQLREEEIARTLAMLEARFRKMLEMQLAVYESTRRLDQLPEENRGQPFFVQTGKLSSDERKIAVEAQKALTLLQEEGSSVAFPATVEQMQEDMEQVSERLADSRVDDITIGIEEDIIQALEEMIAALQKAQQEQEEKQQQQQQQQQQEQEQPLVDQIAELRMIKSLQERVNKRTQRYSRLLTDDQDPVGQADGAELTDAVRKLADRQQEIFQITRDIVLGKNK